MAATETTYLVTGANRGIGLGLTRALLQRPNTTVVAAVRNPSTSSASLTSLPLAQGSKLLILPLDASVPSNAGSAISELQGTHNIDTVDIVIANAGIASHYAPAATTSIDETKSHYEVNFIGQLALFQAVLPLLQRSRIKGGGKFVGISTAAGSIGDMEKIPMPNTAYGASKAALNFFLRKAHFENEGLVVYALNPGWVQTDMGNYGAATMGIEAAPTTLEESVGGILNNVDKATREKTGGTFQSFDGDSLAW